MQRGESSPIARTVEEAMFEPMLEPFIHDPGNGPRVRDMKMFIKSSFAQPVGARGRVVSGIWTKRGVGNVDDDIARRHSAGGWSYFKIQ
jgi:hypothetical protein